jgi:hypothetical protein
MQQGAIGQASELAPPGVTRSYPENGAWQMGKIGGPV